MCEVDVNIRFDLFQQAVMRIAALRYLQINCENLNPSDIIVDLDYNPNITIYCE